MSQIIAIPTEANMVNAHFGRSKAFSLYKISNNKAEWHENLNTSAMLHQHGQLATLLKEKGVSTVICGGIGPGAISGLESVGIEVLRGAVGLVEDVATSYADGSLKTTDMVCDHSHGGHHHHH